MTGSERRFTWPGAIAGGIIGGALGGSRGTVVGAVTGAALGGLTGNAIGRDLDEQDRIAAMEAQDIAFETGRRRPWRAVWSPSQQASTGFPSILPSLASAPTADAASTGEA